ncbi:7846_t:CDS:2, partial [Dentiscutata erythropus]
SLLFDKILNDMDEPGEFDGSNSKQCSACYSKILQKAEDYLWGPSRQRGHKKIESVIKEYKAEVNHKNQNGKTALHWAAKNGCTFIVENLIENKAQVNDSDNNGDTPLFYAVEAGYENVINFLINHQADVNHINNNGEIALHKAAYRGHRKVVQILLEKNAKIKFASNNGWTALHFAAAAGHIGVIKILLEHNGNIKTTSEYSKTALYCAAENKHTETVKYLLEVEARSDKDFNKQYFYHIYFAAKKRYDNAVKLLLETTNNDYIRLHYIAGKGYIKAVKFLLKAGAKQDIIDENGRTPLHWAAFEDDEEIVKDLVGKNINLVEFTDNNKETALYEAVWNGHMNIVEFLHNQDKKINCENISGWKPLHIAAISCQVEVKENKQTLEEEQSELKKKLVLRQILEILKIVGQTISVVGGPIGIASGVIKGGDNIVKAFISEENKSKSKFEIPQDIKDSLKNMKEMVKSEENEIKIAEQQLKKLSYECNKYTDLSNIKVNLIKIQKKLSEVNFKKTIVKEIKDELVQIQTKLEELKKKNENATANQKTSVKLRVIQDFKVGIETIENVIELYVKYQEDKERLDALSNSIKQADDENKINNKSHVFLDLTKWKVQNSLESIRNEIQKISKGFDIQEDTICYMEKLDEGRTTLINIYDCVQDYYDQANLASYIAHIYSATNEESATIELEQEIRANILTGHFKRAKSAFNQWVFPLANEYLKALNSLDQDIDNNKDIDSIISQINILHSVIQERKLAINNEDRFLVKEEFSSEYESSNPFFVWEGNIYSQEISKLLSGEEITIKAEITKSDHDDKNAIKIGIKFKSENETIQNEIDRELKHFNVNMFI